MQISLDLRAGTLEASEGAGRAFDGGCVQDARRRGAAVPLFAGVKTWSERINEHAKYFKQVLAGKYIYVDAGQVEWPADQGGCSIAEFDPRK